MKPKSNKHKLEKRKKNSDERGREKPTSERKKSYGEGGGSVLRRRKRCEESVSR